MGHPCIHTHVDMALLAESGLFPYAFLKIIKKNIYLRKNSVMIINLWLSARALETRIAPSSAYPHVCEYMDGTHAHHARNINELARPSRCAGRGASA